MVASKKVSGKKASSKKTSAKKVKAPVAKTPAPVETPKVETPKVEASVVEPADELSEISNDFSNLITQLRSAQSMCRELTLLTSRLEKRVAKSQKALLKRANGKQRRKKPEGGQPSGFSKPGPVSDEMRAFLKLGPNDLIARTEVTKRINAYCKERGLQGKEDKRQLLPDKALKTLLRLGKGDNLTFFNLQKYMKVHFPNKEGVYPTA
jgi:upstream activation factor subunit UAF30